MNKKFIYSLIIILSLFILVGCNKNEIVEEKDEYSLVSTEERLVFKKENNYEIFYLNTNVTKIEKAKAFSNNYYATEYYSKQNALKYKSVRCIENLVIFEMNDEYLKDYEGLQKSDVMFSMVQAGFEYIEES